LLGEVDGAGRSMVRGSGGVAEREPVGEQ